MAHRWAEMRWNELETQQPESPVFILPDYMFAPLGPSQPGLSLRGATLHTRPSVSIAVSGYWLDQQNPRGLL